MTRARLPGGIATGLGSLLGDDPAEAARMVIGELPELPHVPELPDRGPWAETVGRAGGLLVDLPIELEVGRWRTASREGRDVRRARSLMAQDLDAVEEQWSGYSGPAKLQVCGPLTLMASVELRGSDPLLADAMARADLAASLAEGVIGHLQDVRRRLPAVEWCVQVDQPLASSVTNGTVSRPSGWGTVPAVGAADAAGVLRLVVDGLHAEGAGVVVHSCDPDPAWSVLTQSHADAISVGLGASVSSVSSAGALEEWWGDDGGLWMAVATADAEETSAAAVSLQRLRSMLGADPDTFADRLVLTPECRLVSGRLASATGQVVVGAQAYAGVRALIKRLNTHP